MTLVIDESVDAAITGQLRADGHDVVEIRQVAPGVDDDTVLQFASDRAALLVTEDKHFGELVFRLAGRVIRSEGRDGFHGTVTSHDSVRIRRS